MPEVPLTPTNPSFDHPGDDPKTNTPIKRRTPDARDSQQTVVRQRLGGPNNPDMFVTEIGPFLDHYGPCAVSDDQLNASIEALTSTTRWPPLKKDKKTEDLYWRKFSQPPSQQTGKEDTVFASLKDIVKLVMDTHKSGNAFHLVPNSQIESDIAGSNHRIDACYAECGYGDALGYRHVRGPMEFKKKRTKNDRAIVHLQILGACNHIMNEDPRRMWIYGLTIEDSVCSMWYFSRSHSVKSRTFDWLEEPKTFIRILTIFAIATPSQLGIDETVHVGPNNSDGKASYVYETKFDDGRPPLFFRTLQALSLQRPLRIAGRITRVWTVVQVSGPDGKTVVNPKKVVLKDVWLDHDNSTEAKNMDDLFASVHSFVEKGLEAEILAELDANQGLKREALFSNQERMDSLLERFVDNEKRFAKFDADTKKRLRHNLTNQNYKALFLTKLHAWQGATCRALAKDIERHKHLFSLHALQDLEENEALDPNSRAMPTADATAPGLADDVHVPEGHEDVPRRFAAKTQSRFVYEEVCTTVQNLGTMGEAIDVLCQAIDAMHIFLAAGWVHRDISSNNVMAYRPNPNTPWAVKIADLEFSRIMVDPERVAAKDPRTGTPFFMPVEITRQQYLFHQFVAPRETSVFDSLMVEAQNRFGTSLGLKDGDPRREYLDKFINIGFNAPIPPEIIMNTPPPQNALVNHNYAHDLESIWWIILWLVTSRVNNDTSKAKAAELFSYDVQKCLQRQVPLATEALMNSSFFIDVDKDLKDYFGPILELLRKQMYQDYIMRPIYGDMDLPECYSNIHAKFAQLLRTLHATDGPWKAVPLQRAVLAPPVDLPETVQPEGATRITQPPVPRASSSRPTAQNKEAAPTRSSTRTKTGGKSTTGAQSESEPPASGSNQHGYSLRSRK